MAILGEGFSIFLSLLFLREHMSDEEVIWVGTAHP